MAGETVHREWSGLARRHLAFWSCDEVARPLIHVIHNAYVDTELVAAAMGDGELTPQRVSPGQILAEYDRVAAAREAVGDNAIAVAEPLLGIPWLEAICGCRVMVSDGRSIWPEPPDGRQEGADTVFSEDNPWYRKLLEVTRAVIAHVRGRYAVSISHLRGPTDVLVALMGTTRFFSCFYDEPDTIKRLASQAAAAWLQVVRAQVEIVPSFRGGYGVRQFGLWAPERAVWLQDDTSGMMSLAHYRRFFLTPIRTMSSLALGVFHLHIPSLHIAETLAEIPNVRAINLYFDSERVTLQDAMPVMRRLQARSMPLILAKDVYEGFSLAEYDEILDGLSPRGLSVHLKADSVDEGLAVMDYTRGRAKSRHRSAR